MLSDLRADFERYRELDRSRPAPLLWVRNQGLWALAEHRFGRWVRDAGGPWRALVPLSLVWHMLIEITTGISIGPMPSSELAATSATSGASSSRGT